MNYIKREIVDSYIKDLKECQEDRDIECAHVNADGILCRLLNELGFKDVVEEYNKVDKWFS